MWCTDTSGDDAWLLAEVVKKDDDEIHLFQVDKPANTLSRPINDDKESSQKYKGVELANAKLSAEEKAAGRDNDLITLPHLHEPALLHAVAERFFDGKIYTWTGPVLIAVNPFQRLPLYTSVRAFHVSTLYTYTCNACSMYELYLTFLLLYAYSLGNSRILQTRRFVEIPRTRRRRLESGTPCVRHCRSRLPPNDGRGKKVTIDSHFRRIRCGKNRINQDCHALFDDIGSWWQYSSTRSERWRTIHYGTCLAIESSIGSFW